MEYDIQWSCQGMQTGSVVIVLATENVLQMGWNLSPSPIIKNTPSIKFKTLLNYPMENESPLESFKQNN